MSWFFSRRKRQGEYAEEVGVASGAHRSPGLAALTEELDKRVTVGPVLDLGGSFHENVTHLSRYSSNLVIRDLVNVREEELSAPRGSPFELDADALDAAGETRYDVILLWDLLHYVDRSRLRDFAGRIAKLANPGALLLLLASGSTPIPLTPVRFKIRDPHCLVYQVRGERRSASPHFTPREIEKLLCGFRPVRSFQLRNGLQEFLLRYEEPPREKERVEETRENPGLPGRPEQPGDWY